MEESSAPQPPTPNAQPDLQHEINALRTLIQALEQRITSMERKQSSMPALPQTSLLSGSFLARSFAVMGHYLVAALILTIPVVVIMFVIMLAIGIGLSGM